jgi:hypothetical protein
MLILGISRTVFNYNLEKGIILDLINLQYANSNAQDYQDSYQNLYSYKDGKYYFSQYYDNYKDTYEIETNYNFISWKASAANFCLTDISDPVIIPFILGFGNGFEFKEGVDYSGETEEPLKKNDETLEPVQPEKISNNKPIIYAVSTLIIIILASVLIIVFKKKKNH